MRPDPSTGQEFPLAVNFYDIGDVVEAADVLNGVG